MVLLLLASEDSTTMRIVAYTVFLLHFILVTAQECTTSTQGDVRIIGTETLDLIAGRIEICISRAWKAVYDESWGAEEARIVCIERGFPSTGAFLACGSSCLGASSLTQGFTGFTNCINQNNIFSCGIVSEEFLPDRNAGVVCIRPNDDMSTPCLSTCCPGTPFPTSCLSTECPITPSTNCSTCPTTCSMFPSQTEATPTNSSNSQNIVTESRETTQLDPVISISIIACLGGLSGFLFLILVCVVSGWVCSSRRNKGSAKINPQRDVMDDTPSYTQAPFLSLRETNMQPNPSYTAAAASMTTNPSLNPTGVYYSTIKDREYQEIPAK